MNAFWRTSPWIKERGSLVAIAASAAILIIFLGSVFLLGGPATDEPVAVGSPMEATIDEFDAAVRPAVETLVDAPGFRAAQTGVKDNGTTESVWLDYRVDGEPSELPVPGSWAVVEVIDSRNGDSGVFRVTANIVTGDSVYTAQFREADNQNDASWFATDRFSTNLGLSPFEPMPVPMNEIGDYLSAMGETARTEVFRQDADDGGSLWTMTRGDADGGTTTEVWGIHPDGYLRSYHLEIERGTLNTSTSLPEPSRPAEVDIDFTLQPESSLHTPPESGSSLDLGRFDLPLDFPIED